MANVNAQMLPTHLLKGKFPFRISYRYLPGQMPIDIGLEGGLTETSEQLTLDSELPQNIEQSLAIVITLVKVTVNRVRVLKLPLKN